jgi:diacylglycerol O-acyltransferase
MSAADAGFLYLERSHALLHIGLIAVVDGSVSAPDVVRRIEARLHRLPRYRQRAVPVPLGVGHPSWEDDPGFDVRNHVHLWALSSGGGEPALLDTCARLFAQPLDRGRPLWEVHVLEGLEGGRTAVLQKVHHCMVDGVSGARLLEELLDRTRHVIERPPPLAPGAPPPSRTLRLGRALGDGLRRQLAVTSATLGALGRPRRARESARRLLDGAWSALRLLTDEIPELPWNAPLGPRRRLAVTRLPLAGVRRIRASRGGTVNDVVLCVLAGGLHRYLRGMGVDTARLEPTALVPVSLRSTEEAGTMGNRISAMLVPLAADIAEEPPRLAATRAITQRLRAGGAWTGIDALLELLDGLPPGLVALAGRSLGTHRIANVVATNVRGPAEERWLCGERVEALYPLVPIADGIGLGLAVFSYDGWLQVGLNADAGLVPDLDKLRQGIEESFARLLAGCA